MAQLVARFHGMEEVRGSNPLSSTSHRVRTLANNNVGGGSGLVSVCGPGESVGVDL